MPILVGTDVASRSVTPLPLVGRVSQVNSVIPSVVRQYVRQVVNFVVGHLVQSFH